MVVRYSAVMSSCAHVPLTFGTGTSVRFDYRQPTEKQIHEALHVSDPPRKKLKKSSKDSHGAAGIDPSTFPAPLVLPGGELAHDPEYPPQSVQEWIDEEARNEVTKRHRTIYLVPPPSISDEVPFVNTWTAPAQTKKSDEAELPNTEDVAEYLRAFYHGMPVKVLSNPKVEFNLWEQTKTSKAKAPQRQTSAAESMGPIGLSTGSELVCIRARKFL